MSEEEKTETTPFKEIYDLFLASITDDMFMEMTREDTIALLKEILLRALPMFEFPRVDIFDLDVEKEQFNCKLNYEEENILSHYMVAAWMDYQLASVENVRQKYSSSDFSFTSQASHMSRLIDLKQHYKDEGFHLQRLYCRRRLSKIPTKRTGYVSDFERIMEAREW